MGARSRCNPAWIDDAFNNRTGLLRAKQIVFQDQSFRATEMSRRSKHQPMHGERRIRFVVPQNPSDAFAMCRKEKFVVIEEGDPTSFMLMICDTMLVRRRESRSVRPFIKRDASFVSVGRERLDVIVCAIIIIEIKMFEPDDLMKLNPFR